eukprot:TRINITY_DN32533_c0_g1_i1.p1 TRINITY_DN32533_c0_g1~~TRINITY_DN32533_c0_g1_i1.p1  ORF type:complete len:602 (+),score=90.61 TRINITY_DN32533_c0_g1_i1:564-2369(+)
MIRGTRALWGHKVLRHAYTKGLNLRALSARPFATHARPTPPTGPCPTASSHRLDTRRLVSTTTNSDAKPARKASLSSSDKSTTPRGTTGESDGSNNTTHTTKATGAGPGVDAASDSGSASSSTSSGEPRAIPGVNYGNVDPSLFNGDDTPGQLPRARHRITQAQAMSEFLLTKRDLAALEPLKQKSHALDLNKNLGTHLVYDRQMVEDAVISKWGEMEALQMEKKRRAELSRSLKAQESPIFRWLYTDVRKPNDAENKTQRLVMLALAGNACLAGSKLGAYFFTGSGSLLAEGVHSCADLFNQCMLLAGLTASRQAVSAQYPYGHAPERFVFALMSATGVFLLGGGATILHGVDLLLHPVQVDMGYAHYGLGVLAFAGCVEGFTASVAIKTVRHKAQEANMGFFEYIMKGRDSVALAVLLEDSAAVTGCLLAMSCLGASLYTHNPIFDAVGTIGVGTLMSSVALFLIKKNRTALIGAALPDDRLQPILSMLQEDPVIREIHEVKAVMTGVDTARFKAEIYFNGAEISRRYLEQRPEVLNMMWRQIILSGQGSTPPDILILQDVLLDHGELVVEAVGDEIDRLEDTIRTICPEITQVDIEVL